MKLPPYESGSVAAALGAWAILASIAALVLGMALIPQAGNVPGYALDSVFIFRLERSLAIAIGLIAPTLVIGPLLSGALPRRLSSDGIDWEEDRATVVKTFEGLERRLEKLESAIARMAEINDG